MKYALSVKQALFFTDLIEVDANKGFIRKLG